MPSRTEELYEAFANEKPAKLFGAKLELLMDGQAAVSCLAREDFIVFAGMVQGGITAVIADYAGVFAAMSKIPSGHCPAENMNIDFLRPVKNGDKMLAVAKVTHETRSNYFVKVEVSVNGEKYVAIGSIKFAKPRT